MKRAFRKYHRTLSVIVALPLILTTVTGMLVTMVAEWNFNLGISRNFLLGLHSGELFHLGGIYPILNGLGLAIMLITGLSMSGLFRKKPSQPNS
ncbi:MAG: peptidase [Timaviella obliquedivisa GSE-PSE-MK23-08B]|jgi:uncharacterized membrane-anchored protein YitT (DUF2179 family)|nr:peptidase [Timaviella obliquedivisa GSE-PSE-MK23-08B]